MNAPASPLATIPTEAGTPFAGGLYAGRFFVGAQPYALVVAPAAIGEIESAWGKVKTEVVGAISYNNGLANTEAMVAAGSKLGAWARALRIDGFDDWYLPSRLELLLAWGELKATPAFDFQRECYWSSTQYAGDASCAWGQYFGDGNQDYHHKGVELRARAVRRAPIQ